MPAPNSDAAARSAPHSAPANDGGLLAAQLTAFDAETRTARIALGSREVDAVLDDTPSPRVLATALARGERLIAANEEGAWVVLGALRTAPTPGVDEGDDVVIKARRLTLHADNELALTTGGAASFVLRAAGFVETVAQDITTRASGIHKIVGRLIRLNQRHPWTSCCPWSSSVTPEGRWRLQCPRFHPGFTRFALGVRREHRTDLDTVLLDADAMRVELTWHAAVPLPQKFEMLEWVQIVEKKVI